ncbi:hypothetical protein AB0395_05695 [Streptosporangium sp. NPDC051023]|uniref:hypothetical protein n=1 Tax=Streptosporangium sp. NPDC051023 TaxID=3155410 RepID=UPI00344FDA88
MTVKSATAFCGTVGFALVLALGVLLAGHGARAATIPGSAARTAAPTPPPGAPPASASPSGTPVVIGPTPAVRPKPRKRGRALRHHHRDLLDCMERWNVRCERGTAHRGR